MAFCSNCGTQLQGDERFCVNCGNSLSSAPVAGAIPIQHVALPGQSPPGAIPVPIGVPQAPKKRKSRIVLIAIILLVVAAGYYFVTHHQPPATSDENGALAAQQDFDAHWENANGYVLISKARWTNHSGATVQSVTLQCDQYDQGGSDLGQKRTTLSGPLQPGASDVFDPFQMGAVAANLSDVKCTIVDAQQPAGAVQ